MFSNAAQIFPGKELTCFNSACGHRHSIVDLYNCEKQIVKTIEKSEIGDRRTEVVIPLSPVAGFRAVYYGMSRSEGRAYWLNADGEWQDSSEWNEIPDGEFKTWLKESGLQIW